MNLGWLRLRWLFSRHAGRSLLWVALLFTAAVIVNVIGIRLLGDIDAWQRWMEDHTGHFLAWRLLLYAGTTGGWMWMRRRLLIRESDVAARQRLQRTEIAVVLAVVALESSALLRYT